MLSCLGRGRRVWRAWRELGRRVERARERTMGRAERNGMQEGHMRRNRGRGWGVKVSGA